MASVTAVLTETPFPFVLTIGTTEPFVSAGLQLDLYLAERLQFRPLSVVAAVSAQNGRDLFACEPVSAQLIHAQLTALTELPIKAIRLGALRDARNVEILAQFCAARTVPIIYDPVFATSAGGRFVDDETLQAITTYLLPHVSLVTPNLAESAMLSGIDVHDETTMEAAAERIIKLGVGSVVIKGGHLTGAPLDVFFDGIRYEKWQKPRIQHDMRGTGCVLAIAAAAACAHGFGMSEAIQQARETVRMLIEQAQTIAGMRIAR